MPNFNLNNISAILSDVHEYKEMHHLGRPFMSAYQIAIEYYKRYPEQVDELSLPVGGESVGAHESLAQQIARFLSQAINEGRASNIEGGFISHSSIKSWDFFDPDGQSDIKVSTLNSKAAHTIFRLR